MNGLSSGGNEPAGPVWSELLSAALVGTERRPAPHLLDDAAALAVARRAGVPAIKGLPRPASAPEESARLASPAATARLAGLLSAAGGAAGGAAHGRVELVAEWLATAAAYDRRVGPAILPDLLDAARAYRSLRPLVSAAGGARAGWLAAQRPTWAYLLREPDESAADDSAAWEEGTIGQRVGYLRAARRRDPEAARALLEAGWAGEAADDRASLLEALRTGLSTADAAFLELALDDRRGQVRSRALRLLTELPDSAYGRRMAARAGACVRRDGQVLRIVPPRACDAAMRRDGIAANPPAGVGARAWWLEEIVARTPLRTWPAGLLALAVADGWDRVLHRGLARAAAAQSAPGWAAALLEMLEPQVAADPRPDDVFLLESLYEVLPAGPRADRAVARLRSATDEPGLDRLLELCPGPWPPALAAAFRDHLAGLVRRAGTGRRVRERCRTAATRLPPHPGLLDGILPGSRDDPGGILPATRDDPGRHGSGSGPAEAYPATIAARQAVQRLAETLRFRRDMIEELR